MGATIGIESDFPYVKIVSDFVYCHWIHFSWISVDSLQHSFSPLQFLLMFFFPIGRFLLNQWLGSVKAVNVPRLSRCWRLIYLPELFDFLVWRTFQVPICHLLFLCLIDLLLRFLNWGLISFPFILHSMDYTLFPPHTRIWHDLISLWGQLL